ncbi:hypothetical protein BDQ94DRAFT_148017 [Aspergillus welwitschiae]|uniref:Uncharacterized protein n=1 Tax=Aspergillus welwitschiae TaxID=1341132 RepID=A0A3F3PVM1_9EURO|nr:hypothetical protein BDQ94DRAFT_148017 [Aspergillus welwitschiae]RDH30792.1 hypothetical protein BDQ94DRAFT_148017 [Aspergillus welwitschiae]
MPRRHPSDGCNAFHPRLIGAVRAYHSNRQVLRDTTTSAATRKWPFISLSCHGPSCCGLCAIEFRLTLPFETCSPFRRSLLSTAGSPLSAQSDAARRIRQHPNTHVSLGGMNSDEIGLPKEL